MHFLTFVAVKIPQYQEELDENKKVEKAIKELQGKATSDDIIKDSLLYDYICRILSHISTIGKCSLDSFKTIIEEITVDYQAPVEGARERLNSALEIIVVTYYSALMKHRATTLLENLGA